METRGLLTLFALALLVALGWWVLRAVQSQREAGLAAPPQTPDYYLYNFTMTAMNAKGQRSL
ncbi:MAG: LPS export ABC transporter periplasmic protein LptC, partial [Gammaproteobacteria bacterium]|nr:LPS export ABC transporter periplasmic protein LptC [Gammaproteobacteria bacterium]